MYFQIVLIYSKNSAGGKKIQDSLLPVLGDDDELELLASLILCLRQVGEAYQATMSATSKFEIFYHQL